MTAADVLVLTPFRRPDFRHAVSTSHPFEEPIDSPAFVVAASCEAVGLHTKVLGLQNIYVGFDERTDLDDLRELLSTNLAPVVIFSSDHFIASRSTATLYGIDLVAQIVRSLGATAIGVCGRLATTAGVALLSEAKDVDFVVVGEADLVIGEIAKNALGGAIDGDLSTHVMTRRDLNDGRKLPEPAFVSDVSKLPIPAFHLAAPTVDAVLKRRSFGGKSVAFSIRTTFGCKFQCKFCAGVPHWRDYRLKSAKQVAAEIDHLYASLPDVARLSFLEDEIATRDLAHTRELSEILGARGIKLDGLYTHSSLLTTDVAESLAPVLDRVFLGLDSPDDSVLRQMGKGQKLDTVMDAVETARNANLKTHLEWIIGNPEDTIDSLITSLNAIFVLIATGVVESINTYVYCPHPGTAYREDAETYGLCVHEPFEMLESGGYPAASTRSLTRNQVFTAYLMSQLVIGEAAQARRASGPAQGTRGPSRESLLRLFNQVGGC